MNIAIKWFAAVGLAAAILIGRGVARADQKAYVWTYDYSTLAKDSAEIEYYQTAVTKDRKVSGASDWQQQVEVEYGITDRLDAAIYQMFEQPADGSFFYAGYKLRLRYRVAEQNQLPVDVLFYAEHVENTDEASEFEGKLVLAKDIGRVNIAYNQVFEKAYVKDAGAEHGYAAGISYRISDSFRLGLESKGSYREGTYAAGPTISWSRGRLWANLGAVFALNDKTNDRETRFLMGIPF
ncbi:MAG: hypothetical protein M0042_12820 [Nitrospiraceae bacterium]|nr:hypothetical protein [Nitrospiraceae bacterium]